MCLPSAKEIVSGESPAPRILYLLESSLFQLNFSIIIQKKLAFSLSSIFTYSFNLSKFYRVTVAILSPTAKIRP